MDHNALVSDLMNDVVHNDTAASRQVSLNHLIEALRKETHYAAYTEGWDACVKEYEDLIFHPFATEK